MRCVCSSWVPHFLTSGQLQQHLDACNGNLGLIVEDQDFLQKVIIVDESWVHYHDPHSPNGRVNTGSARMSGNWKVQQQKSADKEQLIDRLFEPSRGLLSIFPPKQNLIWTIIWKTCWFCVPTLLANDPTFGTPGSCIKIMLVRTLQGRLWSTSNHVVSN